MRNEWNKSNNRIEFNQMEAGSSILLTIKMVLNGQIYPAILYYFHQSLEIWLFSMQFHFVQHFNTNEHSSNQMDNTTKWTRAKSALPADGRNSDCLLANQIYYIPFTLPKCCQPNVQQSVLLSLITLFKQWKRENSNEFSKEWNVWN